MFDAGTLSIAEGNNAATDYSFTAGEFKQITIPNNTSYYISSDQPALLYLVSTTGGSTLIDPKPLLPASNDIIGFPSNKVDLSVDTDGTSLELYISDGSNNSYTGNKSSTMQHTGTGSSTASLYQGYASRYISTGGKIVGSSVADSNGYCTAPFLPVSMMKRDLLLMSVQTT